MTVTFSVPDALAYGADEAMPSRPVGQDVLDAFYNTVHGYPGGAPALAPRLGMSANTLVHKANPNTVSHQPYLREVIAAMVCTGNFSVLHAMGHATDHVVIKSTPDQSGGNPVDAFMHMEAAHGDYVRALADAMLDGSAVTPNQMRRVDAMAQEAIATIGHALAALRARMRQAPEGMR